MCDERCGSGWQQRPQTLYVLLDIKQKEDITVYRKIKCYHEHLLYPLIYPYHIFYSTQCEN